MSRQRVALREFPLNGHLTAELRQQLDRAFAAVTAVEHRGAARHLAAFSGGDSMDPSFWVVRAWTDATPLMARVAQGPAEEGWVRECISELLSIVAAFHKTGMAHGAISVRTVVERDDASLLLLDPSAFNDVLLASGIGGDDGDTAFAAPEQATQGPSKASDLYRVGVMMACLLAGRSAGELERTDKGIVWPGSQSVSPAMSEVLRELTQPDPSKRPRAATDVLASLKAAKENPASLIGVASAWDEYVPQATPSPLPPRPNQPEHDSAALETWSGGLPVDVTDEAERFAEDPPRSIPASAPAARSSLPRPGQGPLPIGMPGPPPPQGADGSWLWLMGCGALLVLCLIGGVGLGVGYSVNQQRNATASASPQGVTPMPAPPAPAPASPDPQPVLPAPVAPDPLPQPVVPVAQSGPTNPALGMLRVRCERRAFIAINGRVVDRTPLDIELTPGEYELTATLPDMPDWQGKRTIQVRRSEVSEVEFHF